MQYITYFDWAALCLLFIMLLGFNAGRNYYSSANRAYRRLILACLAATVFDLLGTYLGTADSGCPLWFLNLIDMIFLGAQNMLAPCFMSYCIAYTEWDVGRSIRRFLSLTGPYFAVLLLILTNPLTHFVFTIGPDRVYRQEWAMTLLYAVAYLYLIGAVGIVFRFRNMITKGRRHTMYTFTVISLAAAVFQYNMPHILITDFASVCAGIVIYIMVQNPADSINRDTGMYSREAFIASVGDMVTEGKKITVVLLTPDNLHTVLQALGYETYTLFLRTLTDYFSRKCKTPVFAIEEGVLAMVANDSFMNGAGIVRMADAGFARPWNISGLEVSGTCSLAVIENLPEPVTTENMLDTVNYAARLIREGEQGLRVILDRVPEGSGNRLDELEKQKLLLEAESREANLAKEKAEQADREKSMFLANTSHEIRTPMNAILGMTDMILRDDINDRVRANANDIKSAGESLLAIINDVLDISKVESGKIETASEEYDLRKVLGEVVRLISTRIDSYKVELITDIDISMPERLVGDEIRVRQILTNLLNNAAKFTQSGHIRLRVGGSVNDYVFRMHVEVEDTGIGIRKEDMDRLFNTFSRIENGSNRYIEGTGLGLALCRQLLAVMGGEIRAESEYGKGSTFIFELPQRIVDGRSIKECMNENGPLSAMILSDRTGDRRADRLKAALEALEVPCMLSSGGREVEAALAAHYITHVFTYRESYAPYREWLKNYSTPKVILFEEPDDRYDDMPETGLLEEPVCSVLAAKLLTEGRDGTAEPEQEEFRAPDAKILLVDDNLVNIKVAQGLLKCFSINAESCTSGAAAIEKAAGCEYDIIFMDHMMPGMDGIEAMHRIRALGGHNEKAAMIALTANAISGVRNMFISEGFDDYLSKPIKLAELGRLLRKYLTGGLIKEEPGHRDSPIAEPAEKESYLPGVDVDKGLTACGHSRERYDELLDTFLKSGNIQRKQLVKLEECGSLSSLRIEMHALAALSEGIGATNICELSRKTENAAQKGDADTVKSNLDVLLGLMDNLLEKIDQYLEGRRLEAKENEEPVNLDPEHLREKLLLVKEALENCDGQAAGEYMDNLSDYATDDKMDEKLSTLGEIIKRFEYDEALIYTEGILNSLGELKGENNEDDTCGG